MLEVLSDSVCEYRMKKIDLEEDNHPARKQAKSMKASQINDSKPNKWHTIAKHKRIWLHSIMLWGKETKILSKNNKEKQSKITL